MAFTDFLGRKEAPGDRSRLEGLCGVVTRGLADFTVVGDALAEIRDSELYKLEAGTFDAFCRERWDMTPQNAGQLIMAASICRQLSVTGSAPTSVRQAVALGSLPEAERVEAWNEAKASATAGGTTPAKAVHEAVRRRRASALPKSGAKLKKRSIRAAGGRVLVEPNRKGKDHLAILRSAVAILETEQAEIHARAA